MRKFEEVAVAPSILKESGATKPSMEHDVPVAPSIIKEGGPTKNPWGAVTVEPAEPT